MYYWVSSPSEVCCHISAALHKWGGGIICSSNEVCQDGEECIALASTYVQTFLPQLDSALAPSVCLAMDSSSKWGQQQQAGCLCLYRVEVHGSSEG